MKKLMVYLDEDVHEELKTLALRHRTSMAELVRYAIDKTFEDQLDVIAADLAFAAYLKDPSSAVTLDDFLKEHGLELPGDSPQGGEPSGRKAPKSRTREGSRRPPEVGGEPVRRKRAEAQRDKTAALAHSSR